VAELTVYAAFAQFRTWPGGIDGIRRICLIQDVATHTACCQQSGGIDGIHPSGKPGFDGVRCVPFKTNHQDTSSQNPWKRIWGKPGFDGIRRVPLKTTVVAPVSPKPDAII